MSIGSIAARERVLRHDVKARIEEFNAAGRPRAGDKGMTSRDLTRTSSNCSSAGR